MRGYTSGAFLFIILSCGELDAAFPTSSGCSGAEGEGRGVCVEGGEGSGFCDGLVGADPHSDGGDV